MLKAIFKSVFLSLLTLTLIFAIGCSSPEEKKNQQLEKAATLEASGSLDEALEVLNSLNEKYPNNAEILRKIGSIYNRQGDATSAAFFLEQAYSLAPDDVELLYATYLAQKKASLPTKELLETLSTQAPEAMNAALWTELGDSRSEYGETQAALDAYLKGVNQSKESTAPETAGAIGRLFLEVGNPGQAQDWLKIAAQSEDPSALTALFGLLEINLSEKDWEAASETIEQLDARFPGAVDASQWANARPELEKWKAAQEAMKAELAALEAAKETAAESDAATDSSESNDEAAEGKTEVVAELEQAEAMADTPAIEVAQDEVPEPEVEAPAEVKAIAFDPAIAIQPAEPDLTIGVSFDQEATSAPVEYSIGTTDEPTPAPVAPQTIETLLADAEQATLDRNYSEAIRLYWQILGRANDRADVWNELSRVYVIDSQLKNAETTALEATRLAPTNTNYMLDYLRVAQRSKPAPDFLAELETAHDRFPRSPEIAVSLARAYERIGKNRAAAITLYNRFIDLAPNHPLRPEAEAAIVRLR
ncbi:MAG: tetratricopeptide repeat protein [Verrucomicrobiota bacterium]